MLREFLCKHRELILYVFFGGLTTAVNWAVYFPLYNVLSLDATVSNVVAWSVSVAFAFLTNKPFVFCSRDWRAVTVISELVKFISARFLSGLLETLGLLVFVTWLRLDGNIIKVFLSVVVVILNYITSKFLIFKK